MKEITIKPDLARRYLLRENLLHVVARHLSAAVGVNNYLKHCPVTSRLLCKSKRSAVPKSVSKVTIATSGTEVPRYRMGGHFAKLPIFQQKHGGRIAVNCSNLYGQHKKDPYDTILSFQATNWRRYSIGVSFVLSWIRW